jgi:uncharacterized protein
MHDILREIDTEKFVEVCRRNEVQSIGIFGSFARGEANENSDIDLLVKFKNRKSLLALVKLERELSESLERDVDLLTEASISPHLLDSILKDLRTIYEA